MSRYHLFDKRADVDEGFPEEMARCEAVCLKCGEQRLIWRFADMDVVNIGPCKRNTGLFKRKAQR